MTRLDSIYAAPGKELRYHYTFSITKSELDESLPVESYNNNIKVAFLAMINSGTKETKALRSLKAIFVHEYYDKNGEFYTEVKIQPKDY